MLLVDYAASSDEDDDEPVEEANNPLPVKEISDERRPEPSQPSAVPPDNNNPYETGGQRKPGRISLPDASVLLNSSLSNPPRSRKREVTESCYLPHRKIPKKEATVAGHHFLLPPQLTGRSNVVTEDISKLFVSKR